MVAPRSRPPLLLSTRFRDRGCRDGGRQRPPQRRYARQPRGKCLQLDPQALPSAPSIHTKGGLDEDVCDCVCVCRCGGLRRRGAGGAHSRCKADRGERLDNQQHHARGLQTSGRTLPAGPGLERTQVPALLKPARLPQSAFDETGPCGIAASRESRANSLRLPISRKSAAVRPAQIGSRTGGLS